MGEGTRIYPERCTKDGAEMTAREIERFWHKQGYPQVKVSTYHPRNDDRGVFSVRSNLINGMPPIIR